MKFGADIVVYSGTKHIDGQGERWEEQFYQQKNLKKKLLNLFTTYWSLLSPFKRLGSFERLETLKLRVLVKVVFSQNNSTQRSCNPHENTQSIVKYLRYCFDFILAIVFFL